MSNSTTPEMDQVHTSSNDEVAPVMYEYSNLVVSCACGSKAIVEEHKQGSVQINLMPVDDHNELVLACKECNTTLTLKLEESIKEDDEIQEDILTDNQEDGSVHGLSGSDERETEVIAEADGTVEPNDEAPIGE